MAQIQTAGRFQASPAGAGTSTFNASANWTAGNTVIVAICDSQNTVTGVTVGGGAATLDIAENGGSNTKIYRRSSVAGGSTAIDVTVSGGTDLTVFAWERDDITALDQVEGTSAGSATGVTVTALAPNSGADRFVATSYAAPVDQASITTPVGYTLAYADINFGFRSSAAANKVVSAVETSSATWTGTASNTHSAAIATYALSVAAAPGRRRTKLRHRRKNIRSVPGFSAARGLLDTPLQPIQFYDPSLSFPAASGNATGTFASTLGGATMAAAGTVDNRGTFASTLAGVTQASSGLVNNRGTFSNTLAGVTLASSGLVDSRGTFASTLAGAAMAATGQILDAGTFASTLAGATMAASGTVGNNPNGPFASTLDGATMASSGQVADLGTFASTLAGTTMAASGAVNVNPTGTFSSTLAGMLMSSAGQINLPGSFASLLDGASMSASGTVAPHVTGTFASTLGGASMTSSGFIGGAAVGEVRGIQRLMISLHL